MKTNPTNRGFTQIIILAIVVIAVLAYFNIDLRKLVEETPVLKQVWAILVGAWNGFLVPLWHFLIDGIKDIFS